MDLKLVGRRALVTGAGGGLGRSIAKALALEGVEVMAVARSEADLTSLASEVKAECGRELRWRSCDLTEGDAPVTLAGEALDTFGAIDILVNNAGASTPVAWDASDEVWTYGMTLNFEVHRRLTQALLSAMMAQKWGRVISVTGSIELKHINVAACAKAALTVWNKGLAEQVGRYGVTCNCIEPGLIRSNQFKDWPAAQIEAAARQTAFRAFGEPDDISNAALFLASANSAYITGTTLTVDGGWRHRSF